MKQLVSAALAASAIALAANRCGADDGPLYSLDVLQHHPYRFVPAFGHASQNPGSPKWFVPGYGYRIPGFGYGLTRHSALSPYNSNYAFGARVPSHYDDATYRYWTNSYGGPWYFPGWSGNTQARAFAW